MANIIPPPPIPGASEDLTQHMAEFNKSIGLGEQTNTTPINPNTYSPRPEAVDIYRQVVGNPAIGSNPGLKKQNLDPSVALQQLTKYNTALANKADKQVSQANDVTQKMRAYTYNGDHDGANFQRYYNSAPFKELGFNPYRNNEALYNNHMTAGDEFVRAAGQWPSLVSTGFMSGVRAWGTMFTDPLAPDLKGAEEMKRAMARGSSTKEGTASFLTNTFLNSGYTIGIGAEMLAETLALAGATALTGGLDAHITLPLWMTRMGKGAAALGAAKETIDATQKLSKISQLKNFWATSQYAKAAGVIGRSINPLENTWEVGKDIVSGVNTAKYADEAAGTIKRFAQFSNNFGEFAKDMVMIKAAVSEADLEGGMVKMDTTEKLIQQYRNNNGGKDPEGDDLVRIENIASTEAARTAYWNLPAIMWSNKFMYETLFAPFEKTAKKGIGTLASDILFKETKDASGKVIGKFTAVSEGLTGVGEKIAAGIKSPKAWGKFGYNYLKQNSAEGIQENIQEAISSGAMAHALDTYNNPSRGSYEGYMGHFLTGMKAQFSAQGAETFAGGFLMGSMAQPFMAAPMFLGETVWNNTINKGKHQEYQAQRKEQLTKISDSLTEFYNNTGDILAPDLVNAVKQGYLQKEFVEANADNNRTAAENAKFTSAFEHIYTAMATGKLDTMLDRFKTLKDLSPEEAAEAFKVKLEDVPKAVAMIDSIVARGKQVEKNYNEVSSSYPNLIDPDKYRKKDENGNYLKYEDQPEEYKAQLSAHLAWEEATKNFVFARTDFEEHSARIEQLASTLVGKRNPIKNANAQDLFILMDKIQMNKAIIALGNDIKNSDSTTAEGRKIIKEKEKRIELLTEMGEKFTLLTSPKFDLSKLDSKERKAENKKLKKSFKNYINHISDATGDLVFDDELNHALALIMDNYTLRDSRASLVKSINILNNPKGFLRLQRSLETVFSEMHANQKQELDKRIKEFVDNAQLNQANNELYKLANVFLTPNYTLYLKNALNKNEVIELPKQYISGTDLTEIVDPNSPEFKKAEEVMSNIIKGIQAENPVAPVVPEEKEVKKGRLIYATKGSGKTTLVKKVGGDFVDADDLLVTEIQKINATHEDRKATPEGEAPQITIKNFMYASSVPKEEKVQLYESVRNQIKTLVDNGKTVLTGSTDFIKDADQVYIQEDEKRIGLEGDALTILKEREITALGTKIGIPLNGDIADKLGLNKTEQEKLLSEEEQKHKFFVGDYAAQIKNRQEDIDKLIKLIDDRGITVDGAFPDEQFEDGTPFMEQQIASDDEFKTRIDTHDTLKEVTAPPTSGQLEAITNLKRVGFLNDEEVGPTDEVTDLGAASYDITLAVRRIQWMKVKSEENDNIEEVMKLNDYLSDIQKLQGLGDRIQVLRDTYNLLINKNNEPKTKHIENLDRIINKYQGVISKSENSKNSEKWYAKEKVKFYQAAIDALKNARLLVDEKQEEKGVTEIQDAGIDITIQVQTRLNEHLGVTSKIVIDSYLNGLHYIQTEDGKYYIIPDTNAAGYGGELAAEVTKEQIIKPFRTEAEWKEVGVTFSETKEDVDTLSNRLRDLLLQKEKYETAGEVREGTPDLIIADKWKKITKESALEETGLKPKGKDKGEIDNSLLGNSVNPGQTVQAAAEDFVEDHGDELHGLDVQEVRNIIIDILYAGTLTEYRAKRINNTGIRKIKAQIKEVEAQLDDALRDANLKPKYTTMDITVSKKKGKRIQFHNLPEFVPVEYFLYKEDDGQFYISEFTNIGSPLGLGSTEEDAINMAFNELSELGKVEEPVEAQLTLDQKVSKVNDVVTFDEYDEAKKDVFAETNMEDSDVLISTLNDKLQELMTNKKYFTPENLSQANKKGYKLVINDKIYATFTVSKKNNTVSIKSPLGTGSEKFNISQIDEITMRNVEAPIAISTETKGQAKEIMSTGTEVVSSDDLQKANDEAKTQSNESINDDFFNNLGCK